MRGSDILKMAQSQGYKVRLRPDGKIGISPPMPPDTKQVFITHRLEIIQALKDDTTSPPPPARPPEPRQAILTRRSVVLLAIKKSVADPLEQSRVVRFAESESRSYATMFEIQEQADRDWFFCNEIEDYLRDKLGLVIRYTTESETIVGWELVPAIKTTALATTPKPTGKQAGQGRLL